MSGIAGGVEIFVPVAADVLEAESARLRKNREKVLVDISKSESKLGNEQFVSNAPEEIVSREKERLAGMKSDLEKLDARIAMLGGTA
ncbi:MAG: Valine--tRNA ligase [bacterium ADurb.Bin236]|nr:MAG: Valine--tRNA ligase [bacterium ADurb.Bin236]